MRQLLAPCAAVALIAGGIAMRPVESMRLVDSPLVGAVASRAHDYASPVLAAFFGPPEEGEAVTYSGSFSEPLASRQAVEAYVGASGGKGSLVTLRQVGDEGDYELVIKDGKVSAKIDGQPVPEDRILEEGGQVKLLDENGKVVATFRVGGGGTYTVLSSPRVLERQELFGGGGSGANVLRFSPMQSGTPKVMLGVTMSDASPEVLKYFEIEPPAGIVLDRVYEGLPAAKAGLESRDIVVKIEGVDEASQEALRSVLRKKEPGQDLKVKVLRKGETKEYVVELEAYDAERLGIEVAPMPQGFDEDAAKRFGELRGFTWAAPEQEEARRAFEEAMKALGNIDKEEVAEKARRALEEAMAQLEKGDAWAERLGEMEFDLQVDPHMQFRVFTDDEGELFALPGGGAGASTFEWRKADDRLQELDERLKRLEEKLGRLEKLLGELTDDR